ncbi:MAG: damage repair protein, partial [Bacilli bacterium]|nr:damage repair protein [Bacilli bacterium]
GLDLCLQLKLYDTTRIKDLKNQKVKDKSFSHSQVLFKDYFAFNIPIIIYEMVDVLCRRLRSERYLCQSISFGINYSKKMGGGFYHSQKLDALTNEAEVIYKVCMFIFDQHYHNLPIRKVSISLSHLVENTQVQLNLFESFEEIENKTRINSTIDEITNRFGKNSLLKASSLLKDSTIIDRNNKIGGHRA